MGYTHQMCQGWNQQAATDAAQCAKHTSPFGLSPAAWLVPASCPDMGCDGTLDCRWGAYRFTKSVPLHARLGLAIQPHLPHKCGSAGFCCGCYTSQMGDVLPRPLQASAM